MENDLIILCSVTVHTHSEIKRCKYTVVYFLSDYVFKEKTIQDSKEKLYGVHEEKALKSEFHQTEKLPNEDISNVMCKGNSKSISGIIRFYINKFHDRQLSLTF